MLRGMISLKVTSQKLQILLKIEENQAQYKS